MTSLARYTRIIASLAAATALVASCSSATSTNPSPTATATAGASASASATVPTGTITVFAAASLKEVFTSLAKSFEAAHPGTSIQFSFGASSTLAAQIDAGAPADVFASASTTNMDQVVAAGYASGPTIFAKNSMEIATPPMNPGGIKLLSDLARSGVKVALCQPAVPCGVTAAKVFTKAQLTVTPATLEPDVKAVLTKVELGEVDAGVVYVTDVRAAGAKVNGVVIPDAVNATTAYPIAALSKSANSTLAQAFVNYVLSADGLAALNNAGFATP